MSFKSTGAVFAYLLSLSATAGTMGPINEGSHPWSVVGSMGYTWYDAAYSGGSGADLAAQNAIGDGQTAFGRFAIARNLYTYSPQLSFGATAVPLKSLSKN